MTESIKKRGRPLKNPDRNINTKNLLIRTGVEILTEQSFSASGLDSILRRAGVPKGSFYYYFKNKEDFGKDVLSNYAEYFLHKLRKHLLNEQLAPLDRIRSFTEDAKFGMEKYDFNRGCLVGNFSQEISTLPESYRELLRLIFDQWQTEVAICLKDAQEQAQISDKLNCAELAEYFWIGWEGAVLRARIEQSATPLDRFINYFMAGISSATTTS